MHAVSNLRRNPLTFFWLQSARLAPGPVQTNAPFQNEDGED